MRRDIEVHKTANEKLREEVKRGARDCEAIIAENQQNDKTITESQDKIERCKRTLKLMQKVGTSPSVVVEDI